MVLADTFCLFQETCAEYDMKLMDVETQEIFELLPGLVEQFILQKGYTMNWSHETSYSWWINMRVKRSQRPQNDQLVWRTQRLKFFDMETDKGGHSVLLSLTKNAPCH